MAMYKLPKQNTIHTIVGKAKQALDPLEQAFVFAPFDSSQLPYYIPCESTTPIAIDTSSLAHSLVDSTTHLSFTDNVSNIISAIKTGSYTKVVAARVSALNKKDDFDPITFFLRLTESYPDTFVSLVYIHEVGLWLGATPELLLSYSPSQVCTYSLAATKAVTTDTIWSAKEMEEQSIVTDFMQERLAPFSNTTIDVPAPRVMHIGTLRHLLTELNFEPKADTAWQDIVKAIHPSPAVSGMPQADAIQYIQAKEGFDRRFYAGYVGEVNSNGKTDLYVNLRCMEITQTQMLFYAGGGITLASDRMQEWQETEAKLQVLQSLL